MVAGLISHFTSQTTNSWPQQRIRSSVLLTIINNIYTEDTKNMVRGGGGVESPPPLRNTKRGCNEAFMLFSRKFNPILPAGDALKFKNVKKKNKNHSIYVVNVSAVSSSSSRVLSGAQLRLGWSEDNIIFLPVFLKYNKSIIRA